MMFQDISKTQIVWETVLSQSKMALRPVCDCHHATCFPPRRYPSLRILSRPAACWRSGTGSTPPASQRAASPTSWRGTPAQLLHHLCKGDTHSAQWGDQDDHCARELLQWLQTRQRWHTPFLLATVTPTLTDTTVESLRAFWHVAQVLMLGKRGWTEGPLKCRCGLFLAAWPGGSYFHSKVQRPDMSSRMIACRNFVKFVENIYYEI